MEYSLEFSERLIESADALFHVSPVKNEAGRAILYLSCLSCEISLKALLESCGYSPSELKRHSHKLDKLLNVIGTCKFIGTDKRATSIRSKEVVPNTANGTVGTLLDSSLAGGSVYPNEIRYGEVVTHFPPEAMLNCAKVVNNWCKEHKGGLVRAVNS
ncbi:hypothetical protein MAQ5080_01270 [Marinomonas aquimarina]|uniref:HEPN domain-containing protein n=1 Tax=Marinomonas aquimarina TaxID=295068 RepID=A0A1A8T8N3_9GAMM|nr:hypothetical protein [Marinomonas aquimarina]SBS29042.1 hypothetical protein MAQ5080_01270 [Marinomonas aquimarina]